MRRNRLLWGAASLLCVLLAMTGVGAWANGCQAQSRAELERAFGSARASGIAWPAVVSPTGRIIVEARVNGGEPGPFMLGTALRAVALSPDLAARTELREREDIERETRGGTVRAQAWEAASVDAGPVRVRDVLAVELEELGSPFSAQVTGTRVAGVLGLPVLERAVLEVDFARGRGVLVAKQLYDGRGVRSTDAPQVGAGRAGKEAWHPLVIRNRLPLVECRFEGERALFLLDTAIGPGVLFLPGAEERFPALKERRSGRTMRLGVGGVHWDGRGRLDRFEIGGMERRDVEVVFASRPPARPGLDTSVVGIVGVGMFDGWRLVLDIGEARFALTPSEEDPPGGGVEPGLSSAVASEG